MAAFHALSNSRESEMLYQLELWYNRAFSRFWKHGLAYTSSIGLPILTVLS